MADEIIEINQPAPEPEKNPAQERITQLSSKVKSSEEAREAAEAKATEAERNAAFAESFSDLVASNPAVKDYKEDMRAKVKSGMSVQDAMYAVLGPVGKLAPITPAVERSPAGGSATTGLPQGGKSVSEMKRDEKRAALIEAEKRGDLSMN